MSTGNARDARIKALWPALHRALIDVVIVMNQPERDAALLAAAGVDLDRTLFPVLSVVAKCGPISVVEISGHIGRDHTTVSRLTARLETLGLISRTKGTRDRRVKEATITVEGRLVMARIDVAREQIGLRIFRDWSEENLNILSNLLPLLAKSLDENYVAAADM